MTEKSQINADNSKNELIYEMTRSQNHTNDLLDQILNKLDDMSTEQKAMKNDIQTMKNDIHSLATQQRETDAKMTGQFAETNTRIGQLDKQIQELKDKEEV